MEPSTKCQITRWIKAPIFCAICTAYKTNNNQLANIVCKMSSEVTFRAICCPHFPSLCYNTPVQGEGFKRLGFLAHLEFYFLPCHWTARNTFLAFLTLILVSVYYSLLVVCLSFTFTFACHLLSPFLSKLCKFLKLPANSAGPSNYSRNFLMRSHIKHCLLFGVVCLFFRTFRQRSEFWTGKNKCRSRLTHKFIFMSCWSAVFRIKMHKMCAKFVSVIVY